MLEKIALVLILYTILNSNLAAQQLEDKNYEEIDNLVIRHFQKGAYQQAIECTNFAREKAKAEFGMQDSVYIKYTGDIGFFHHQMGQYPQAEAFYLEAQANIVQTYNNNKINEKYTATVNNLAALYRATGRYEMAEPLFGEVISLDKKIFGPNSSQYATDLNNLSLLYMDQNRYAEAEDLLLDSKQIREEIYGKKHSYYATSLNNLAGLYTMMNRYEEAADLHLEAIELRAAVFGKKHIAYSNSLHNLASLYKLQKKYPQAEKLYLQSLQIKQQFLGEKHPLYIRSLVNIADLYNLINEDNNSWAYLQKTIRTIMQIDISMNINKAWQDSLLQEDFHSYAKLHSFIKTLDIAYLLLEKNLSNNTHQQQTILVNLAINLLQKGRHSFFNYKDKLRLLSSSNDWILRNLSLLDTSKEQAKFFEIAEQNKSVLLMESTQTQTIYQMGNLPDSLVQLEQQLIKGQGKVYSQLHDKCALSTRDSLRRILNRLNKKIQGFKTRIDRDFPKYARLKYVQNYAKSNDIQARLQENEALLEYVIADSVVYILYLDKTDLRIITQPLKKDLLEKKIKIMHKTLSNYDALAKRGQKAYRTYTETAHWFYQNLVAPVLDTTNGVKKLILITDGKLGYLPFETFLVDLAPQAVTDYGTLHYLIRDYSISYNYSASLWNSTFTDTKEISSNNRTGKGQILAMAANYLEKKEVLHSSKRLPTYQRIRENLENLPNAREEVKILSKQFSGYFAFDEMASEKVFKEKANQYAVIHLAMHGLLNSKSQMLSSLVFTEDHDSVENNFLQAYEISKLDLNADLVVLSACETGFGKFEKGNGIASLARSFMYAGARSLVVSLWQVNDFSTSEIMKRFYQNLAKKMDIAEALQKAKLDYMQLSSGFFKHPAFWSPFIQIGATAPIQLDLKSERSFLWWGIGFSLIAFLFVVGMRKKR